MSTTVANIITRAGARSNLNDTALIPEASLIAAVSSLEQLVYLSAARGNPDYFGKEGNTNARAYQAAWTTLDTTPGNVAAVSRIEVAAITGAITGIAVGTEVNLVSIRQAYTGLAPRVYMRNRIIREYGSELGTSGSNFVTTLKIFYSHLPTRRTATSDTLDLPDEFDSLVILPLAKLMAVRDQRPDEVAAINEEFVMHWQTFLQAISVYDEATIRELTGIMASYNKIAG